MKRMITNFDIVYGAVTTYKDDYPILYRLLHEQREQEGFIKNSVVFVDLDVYETYLDLVRNHLAVTITPDTPRPVKVTTCSGGIFVAFYENGQWLYRTGEQKILPVDSTVIGWSEYT